MTISERDQLFDRKRKNYKEYKEFMERSEKIDKDYHDKSLRDKTGDKIAEYQEKLKELSIEKEKLDTGWN